MAYLVCVGMMCFGSIEIHVGSNRIQNGTGEDRHYRSHSSVNYSKCVGQVHTPTHRHADMPICRYATYSNTRHPHLQHQVPSTRLYLECHYMFDSIDLSTSKCFIHNSLPKAPMTSYPNSTVKNGNTNRNTTATRIATGCVSGMCVELATRAS
jgi:hypothetical protein